GQVQVPPLYVEQARAAAGKNLTFGIRPEHLEDVNLLSSADRESSVIEAPVDVVEHLGNELLVYMTAGTKQVIARLNPRSDAHTGGRVRLHVDSDNIHLFDSDTTLAYF
ncbi:MAG: TOBE domain-containing protein, partial [Ktedonobacteraceae bacterium]